MLGLDLLAAHMVGDYILQSDDMAKRKLTDWRVRFAHCGLYCIPFFPVAYLSAHWASAAVFMLFLFWTHFITDSRRWASGEAWPPKPVLVDQTLHLVTLALLARMLAP